MKKILLIIISLNLLNINAKAEIAFIDIKLILNKSEVGIYLNNYLENEKKKNYLNIMKLKMNL